MSNKVFGFLLVIIFVLFLSVRLVDVGGDISNSDAARWHRRSLNFLNALKQRDFKSTYQRYHPGVSMMWINSVVEQISLKQQLKSTNEPKTLENADYYPVIHGYSKAANIAVLAVLLMFQVFFISRLFNKGTAFLYAFLISVEPYFIGINRWFHLSSFEVFFGFTSLLSLLMWYKFSKKKYLILSASLLAFSILAKVTSLILGIIFLWLFIKKYLQDKNVVNIFVYGGLVALFVFTFFPALWVAPLFVFNKILEPVTLAVTSNIRSDMIPIYLQPFYYFYILMFKLSPITLLLFMVSIWGLRRSTNENTRFLFITFFVYYIFLTLTEQKIDRYSLAFFPYIILLISQYLASRSNRVKFTVVAASLLFLVWVVSVYHPVYSAYYSPVFGGTKSALNLGIYDNSGEYYAQAANYLNNKGREQSTFVPNGVDSFLYYYKGKLQRSYDSDTNYVLKSLDMDRLYLFDDNCPNLVKTFGSKEYQVVGIFECHPQ